MDLDTAASVIRGSEVSARSADKSSNHRFTSTISFPEQQEYLSMVQLHNQHHPSTLAGFMGFDGFVSFDSGLQSITSLAGGGSPLDQCYSGIIPHEKRQRLSPPSLQNFYTPEVLTTIRDPAVAASAAAHGSGATSRREDMVHLPDSSFASMGQRARNEIPSSSFVSSSGIGRSEQGLPGSSFASTSQRASNEQGLPGSSFASTSGRGRSEQGVPGSSFASASDRVRNDQILPGPSFEFASDHDHDHERVRSEQGLPLSSLASTSQRGRNAQGLSEVLQRFTAPTSPQFDGSLLFSASEPERSSTSNQRSLEGGWALNVKRLSPLCAMKSSLATHDASTMEQLLVHCAEALESNDVAVAQQIMFLLSNIASSEGDPNQRVTACFFKALVRRAGRVIPDFSPMASIGIGRKSKVVSAVEYAGMIDITPWYRFGFKAANGLMMEAFEGKDKVHIIDFSTTYGMQWPTLIESLSERADGPPQVKLTMHKARPNVPPYLGMTEEEIATKLILFASIRNVDLVVNFVSHEIHQMDRSMFDIREDETTVVNCMYRVRYVPDESADPPNCLRDDFLRFIHSLDPALVVLVDEEATVTSSDLVDRLKAAFNYIWIPFDALETFLPRDSPQRLEYELDLEKKIENIIACEGLHRIERLEGKDKWGHRMRRAGFEIVPFSEDVNSEVKSMLSDHAAGWGMKHDEDAILLTWKGHNVLFATAWQRSFQISPC
ncbi:hypothetical protein R1sor_003509 [Riccia sorocarpa]|uniref:Uncharacterized protein n=1 Tax=Riccia sorocarpa TaxID=122646 RepID=A0ABD3H1T6_9MARC